MTAAFGVYGLLIHKQYANLATALLAVVGFVMTAISLYYTFPTSGPDRSRHRTETYPSPSGPKPAPWEPTPAMRGDGDIPVTYGLAFLASAVLSLIGTLTFLGIDIHYTNLPQYVQNMENAIGKLAIIIVCSSVLGVIGLPGFYHMQSAKAPYSSLFGCIAWALSSFFGSMALWALASGPAYEPTYQGVQVNQSYHGLNVISNWLGIIAASLIAIAIIHARVFPAWMAAIMPIGIVISLVWIAGGDNSATSDVIQRLGALIHAATMAAFAWFMLKGRLLSRFDALRDRV